MGWAPEDVARERPDLQALAAYKYDEYQQFFPGMRFVESLALWLSQFKTVDERRIAYEFIKTKLIFCSSAEMNHLVSIAYPDHIRPLLLRRAAQDAGIDERLVSKIAAHTAFKVRQRQCLFLGLSDGARIDVFRRSNSPDLTHEQMLQTYEVSPPRVDELLKKLSAGVATLLGREAPEVMRRFRTIVLLDDFSGSGVSYLRRGDAGSFKGKIGEFHRSLTAADSAAPRLVDIERAEIIVVLYMATDQARSHLETLSKEVWGPLGVEHSVMVVHPLTGSVCLQPNDGNAMSTLIETYYDSDIEDQHTKTGGTDVKYGFARCGLPLVLSHNTPNNSLCLLWADSKKMRALFPRVSRHGKKSMREPRNPFRLRASEHIESDATFLRLFEPAMLDLLPKEQLWERVRILRSAPGGGKTSLMRLFTPPVLLTLHAYRTREDCKELYSRLQDLGVIGEAGPRLLGIMLSCSRNYATLADMEIDDARRERLLFGLLNARVILAALRGALALRKLDYPDGVHRLTVEARPEAEAPAGLQLPCKGNVLYEWAKRVEADVCEAIDSFGPSRADSLPGHDTLLSLPLIRPDGLTINGAPVAERTLVMFDDVHKLTVKQRETLLKGLVELRSPVSTWVAERFEALSADEMLSSGATPGRDYDSVILIERFWREKNRKQRFEKLLLSIADRRARAATAVEIGSFASCLQASLEGTRWQDRITPAINEVAQRVRTLAGRTTLYQEWISAREKAEGTATEKLFAWRTLEILIERDRGKEQKTLDFALSSEELEEREGSDVEAAAQLFLARELQLPYYFGPSRLASLASSNIEQFLWLADDQFEEAVSAALLKKPMDLPPERQEAIIRRAVHSWWEEIPRRVRNGREVRDFLQAIGKFANWATYQPNAPYSPGVTGIAISMADRDRLRDTKSLKGTAGFQKLAGAIASAIAHNLLEPILDYKVKGGRWMVLYLNRALCVEFALPLQYGGFRERNLTELCQWLEQGFRPKKGESLL